MLRSIKRKTEAAFRRRKNNKSIDQIAPVDVDWPIQSDSYPPSTSTEDRTATNTTEPEEELIPAEQALQFRFKQGDSSVVHTPALEEVPVEDPVEEVDVAEQPGLGSYTTKFVPFVETSAMRNNMFVHSANSHYGMVNPAIMGGFGDDDDDSIWLVDDEETEEETDEVTTTVKRGEDEDENEDEEEDDIERDELEEEEEEDEPAVALPPTNQPPPVSTAPEPASTASPDTGFRYRINLALFDDDEFAAPPKETVTVFVDEDEDKDEDEDEDEDHVLNPPSPSIDSTELLSVRNESRRPDSSQDEIAASNGSSTPATSNPLPDILPLSTPRMPGSFCITDE